MLMANITKIPAVCWHADFAATFLLLCMAGCRCRPGAALQADILCFLSLAMQTECHWHACCCCAYRLSWLALLWLCMSCPCCVPAYMFHMSSLQWYNFRLLVLQFIVALYLLCLLFVLLEHCSLTLMHCCITLQLQKTCSAAVVVALQSCCLVALLYYLTALCCCLAQLVHISFAGLDCGRLHASYGLPLRLFY